MRRAGQAAGFLTKVKEMPATPPYLPTQSIRGGFFMSDLSILPVAIFIGMMAAFMLVMLFVVVTDKDPVRD